MSAPAGTGAPRGSGSGRARSAPRKTPLETAIAACDRFMVEVADKLGASIEMVPEGSATGPQTKTRDVRALRLAFLAYLQLADALPSDMERLVNDIVESDIPFQGFDDGSYDAGAFSAKLSEITRWGYLYDQYRLIAGEDYVPVRGLDVDAETKPDYKSPLQPFLDTASD